MERFIGGLFAKGQWLGFLMLACLIFAVSMLTSFFPLWANVPLNVIIPVFLLATRKMVMFEKLKLSTLIIMRAMIVLVLFSLMKADLYIRIVLIFLIINILEATFTDLLKNKMPYNFVTGLALAASVLCLGSVWTAGVAGPYSGLYLTHITSAGGGIFMLNGVKLAATVAWIVAYTLWNWIFVMGEFSPSIAFLHIAILGSPILSCLVLGNPGYWLLMRANSLTFGGVMQISFKEELEKKLRNEKLAAFLKKVKEAKAQKLLMLINLILIAFSAYAYFA